MDLFVIFAPYIYSIRYDNATENEYDRLFEQWHNVEYVKSFVHDNANLLKDVFWHGYNENKVVQLILDEADEFENALYDLCENAKNGELPDFDAKFELIYPTKYYNVYGLKETEIHGSDRMFPPHKTVLRLYAIQIDKNYYVIGGGGIKLTKSFEDTPCLEDEVAKLEKLRNFLIAKGVVDKDDLENYYDEQD